MVDYLLGILQVFLNGAEFLSNRKAQRSKVLSLVRNALRETKKHISDTREGDYGDIESRALAERWSQAAEAIRPFSPRTAQTFEEKSDYWTNPHGFTRDIQNGNRRFDDLFRIEAVEKTLKELEQKWK